MLKAGLNLVNLPRVVAGHALADFQRILRPGVDVFFAWGRLVMPPPSFSILEYPSYIFSKASGL